MNRLIPILSITLLASSNVINANSLPTPGNMKPCITAAEALTIDHFRVIFKERCKTPQGKSDVIRRIQHAKFMADYRSGKIRFSENSAEGMKYLRTIKANPDDPKDLDLICSCGMDNNTSDRNAGAGGGLVQFSSPFEFGLQAIKQCRDRKNNVPPERDIPDLWKGNEHRLPK